jgi:hypothetical protein
MLELYLSEEMFDLAVAGLLLLLLLPRCIYKVNSLQVAAVVPVPTIQISFYNQHMQPQPKQRNESQQNNPRAVKTRTMKIEVLWPSSVASVKSGYLNVTVVRPDDIVNAGVGK